MSRRYILENLLLAILEVLDPRRSDPVRDQLEKELLHGAISFRQATGGLFEGTRFDGFADQGDPEAEVLLDGCQEQEFSNQ